MLLYSTRIKGPDATLANTRLIWKIPYSLYYSYQWVPEIISMLSTYKISIKKALCCVKIIALRLDDEANHAQGTLLLAIYLYNLHHHWMLRGQFLLVVYYLHITTIIYYQSALSGSLPACSSHITCCQKTGSTITSSAVGFHTHIHTHIFFSIILHHLRYFLLALHCCIICNYHLAFLLDLGDFGAKSADWRPSFESHMTKNRAVNLRKAWNLECDWSRGWQCFDAHDNH